MKTNSIFHFDEFQCFAPVFSSSQFNAKLTRYRVMHITLQKKIRKEFHSHSVKNGQTFYPLGKLRSFEYLRDPLVTRSLYFMFSL